MCRLGRTIGPAATTPPLREASTAGTIRAIGRRWSGRRRALGNPLAAPPADDRRCSWTGTAPGGASPAARRKQRARMAMVSRRYVRPGWFTTNVFNRLVALLTRLGVSVYGSRVLAVRGRASGEWRTTPVNLLVHRGQR